MSGDIGCVHVSFARAKQMERERDGAGAALKRCRGQTRFAATAEADQKIVKAAEEHVPTLEYLLKADPMCECDHSVGMAPCFDCALRQCATDIVKAVRAKAKP